MKEIITTLTYPDIGDPEVRIGLRVGDILMVSAMGDPVFLRQLARREVLPSEFAVDDERGSFSETVVDRIREVGDIGAAIRILGIALKNIDNYGTLNGDKEPVRDTLAIMQDTLRREYRLSKKSASGQIRS